MPQFILIAGINGAGKSTFAQDPQFLESIDDVEVINPDIVTRELLSANAKLTEGEANISAANECERRVRALIGGGSRSVVIETVLSSPKYKSIVTTAKNNGYDFVFVYVLLSSAEEDVRRVAIRVKANGHHVPDEKVRARWPKSLSNIPWYWRMADTASIYFNGDAAHKEPLLVANKSRLGERFNPSALLPLLGGP